MGAPGSRFAAPMGIAVADPAAGSGRLAMMPTVRTILGDLDAADLGPTHAHEHLVIDGGVVVQLSPEFQLGDVDRAVAELEPAVRRGLRSIVDAMPCDIGRNVIKLAEISRRSGVNVIAATGLHLARYYPERHWSETASVEELARLFAAEITDGIDAHDYGGPLVQRTEHRAGVVKVASNRDRLSERDERLFEAAAIVHAATGCPILTHCQDGTAALEQVALLTRHGVPPGSITLSHVDRVVDRGYHREIVAAGAFLEYDRGFRWQKSEPNGTLQLIEWMLEDGHGDRILLGLDASRQTYWTTYGGWPGWAYLLGPFSERMAERGIDEAARHRLFVDNPATALSFVEARGPGVTGP